MLGDVLGRGGVDAAVARAGAQRPHGLGVVALRSGRDGLVAGGAGGREALDVGTIDKEDDTVDLGEVVAPQPAG